MAPTMPMGPRGLVVLCCVACTTAAAATAVDIEAWLLQTREVSPYALAPGVAAVVFSADVPEGFVVGSGVQRAGGGADGARPVDEHTLFQLGSITKTLVTLALGVHVARGDMSFDDRVRKWLGDGFRIGAEEYVSDALTVRDLLVHRTGLAQGQGGVASAFVSQADAVAALADAVPTHTLRERFDYSNPGFVAAGEVLRRVAGAPSWCDALHAALLAPLNLTRTYCDRNEVPEAVAARHLAAVHKPDPCAAGRRGRGAGGYDVVPPLATYDFVATGAPRAFAFGASGADGSAISSGADMRRLMSLLLGRTAAPAVLPGAVLDDIMGGHMTVPPTWGRECGVPYPGGVRGRGLTAGLGFDIAGPVVVDAATGRTAAYAEKNGDTDMHKARLGLLPETQTGALLLSNLGGSVGDQLTALKWGILALAVGGSADAADAAAAAALSATDFLHTQWLPQATCTPCGTTGVGGRVCRPANLTAPPFPAGAAAGVYGGPAVGGAPVVLAPRGAGGGLAATFGPCDACPLVFDARSYAAVDVACAEAAAALPLNAWAAAAVRERLAALPGACSVAQFAVPPEIPAAGISATRGTVAHPWGCGLVPLPDGPELWVVTHNGAGVAVAMLGEGLWRQ